MDKVNFYTPMVMYIKEAIKTVSAVEREFVNLASQVQYIKGNGVMINPKVTVSYFHFRMKLLRLDLMVLK